MDKKRNLGVFVWNGKREMQRGGALAFFLIIVFLLALVYLGFQNYKTEDIVSVEAKDFEKTVIYESKPTVVYFYENERSGPHQYMSPALSLFSKRLKDDVKFCTFYMKEKELCETFDIKYDGTTLLFQDGEEVLREAKFAPCVAWHRGLLFEFLEDYIWEQMVRSPSSSATSEVTFISTGEFEQFVLESNKPVIVNFTISSSGCNKVITMMRSFRYAASRYGGLADFYFVDLDDDNSYLQSEYKINSIPMLVMFHNGEERERFAGCYQDLENKRVIIGMIFPYVAFL